MQKTRTDTWNRKSSIKPPYKELLDKYEESFKDKASFKTWKSYYLGNFKEHFGEETLLSNIKYIDLETYRNHLRRKLTKQGTIQVDASSNPKKSCLLDVFFE